MWPLQDTNPWRSFSLEMSKEQLVQRLSPLHGISVAVSREKHGMGGLNDGYYEVLEVLGIVDMQDIQNRAISYAQLDAATYQTMDTTFERDRRLINCVLEGDQNGVLEALALQSASGALDGRNTLMAGKTAAAGAGQSDDGGDHQWRRCGFSLRAGCLSEDHGCTGSGTAVCHLPFCGAGPLRLFFSCAGGSGGQPGPADRRLCGSPLCRPGSQH